MRTLAAVSAVVAASVILFGCDRSPDGYSIEDLQALPEASILAPESTVVLSENREGSTFSGPNNTALVVVAGTSLDARAVVSSLDEALLSRGWSTHLVRPQVGFLVEHDWRSGDFRIHLAVLDPAHASDRSAWDAARTVYQLTLVADGKKGD